MADNSWRDLELWDRVKWARTRRFESATAAAKALGMKEGTYRCYERGPGSAKFIPLEYKHARVFAREFNVRWEWLLDGVGEPWLTERRRRVEDQTKASRPTIFAPGASTAASRCRNWRRSRASALRLSPSSRSGAMDLSAKLLAENSRPALSTTRRLRCSTSTPTTSIRPFSTRCARSPRSGAGRRWRS